MSLLRTTALRASTRTTTPTAIMMPRSYATGPEQGGAAGATANSKGFKQREQGEESKYIREAEQEKLKKREYRLRGRRGPA